MTVSTIYEFSMENRTRICMVEMADIKDGREGYSYYLSSDKVGTVSAEDWSSKRSMEIRGRL